MKKLLIAIPLLVAAGAAGFYWYGNHRVQAELDARIQALVANGSFERLEYEDVQLHSNGDVELTNLHAVKDGDEVVLQNIQVSNFDLRNEIPRTINLSVEGFHFPAGLPALATSDNTPAAALIQSYVVDDTLPLKLQYGYEYDPDNAHQLDYAMSVQLEKAFTLDARGSVRNVPLAELAQLGNQPQDEAQVQRRQQLTAAADVPEALWTLKDEGIVDSLIQLSAEASGSTAAAVREGLTSQVRNMYLFLPQNAQGFGMNAGLQLAAFLEGGRTLSLKVAPEHGGNVQRLQQEVMAAAFMGDIPKIVDLLHLEISAQ